MRMNEGYNPVTLLASGAITSSAVVMGGFLCATSGTLVLRNGPTIGDPITLPSMPVTAGVFHNIPFSFGNGCYAELGGGATGVFGIL